MRETGSRTIKKGEEMATQNHSPLVQLFRRLFGFPEGQPGSCACSSGSAAGEGASREEKKGNRDSGGGGDAQAGSKEVTAGCCGN
jgi:hypothetical protein